MFAITAHVYCECEEGTVCQTPDGEYGVCINGVCTLLSARKRENLQFGIVIKYPEETLQAHNGTDLYIRGNALGFSWKNGVKLNKTGTDTWRIMVIYESAGDGYRCQNCADNTTLNVPYFDYRIYIDDKIDMVGGDLHVKLPMSKSSSYFNEIPEVFGYPWFFSKRGTGAPFVIESPQIGGNRSILLYKPPSFYENTYKFYPTLIVFDLETKTYNVSAHIINHPIVDLETVSEYVMVGFGDYTSQEERTLLLTQVPGPGLGCINGTLANRCDGCFPEGLNYTEYMWYMKHKCGKYVIVGGKGNDTLDFLTDTVLPKAKELTNARIQTDQPNLGIMGYSLGGLMACHAAWTRPTIIGFAACQSPSFWWPATNDSAVDAFFFNNVTLQDETLRHGRPHQQIYLDGGGLETDLPFTLTQAMLSAAEVMETTDAFVWDKNLWAYVFPGEPHNSVYWGMRLWNPLKLFFPARPGPRFYLPVERHSGNTTCDNSINAARQKEYNAFIGILCFAVYIVLQAPEI